MKNISSLGVHTLLIFALLFMVPTFAKSLRPHHYISGAFEGKSTYSTTTRDESQMYPENNNSGGKKKKELIGMELYPTGTGSSLPDCTYACGACSPCKRVMVSSKCSSESCPVVYRCMCKGKYYHVPSN